MSGHNTRSKNKRPLASDESSASPSPSRARRLSRGRSDAHAAPFIPARPRTLSLSSPEMKKTKSGRVVAPALDHGSERIVYDINGSMIGISPVFEPALKEMKSQQDASSSIRNRDKGFKPVPAESLRKTPRRQNLPPRQPIAFRKCWNSPKVTPAVHRTEDHVLSSILNGKISGISPMFQPHLKEMKSQHEAPSSSRKRECRNKMSSSTNRKMPKSSKTSWHKVPVQMTERCIYEIGPPAWIRKEIKTTALEGQLSLSREFYKGIGLHYQDQDRTITLKTSKGEWQVEWLKASGSQRSHRITKGFQRFCKDNEIKEGDWCTFRIVDATKPKHWDVVIDRNID